MVVAGFQGLKLGTQKLPSRSKEMAVWKPTCEC